MVISLQLILIELTENSEEVRIIISENGQRRQRLQLQKNLCFTVTPFGRCLHFKIRNFGGITLMLITLTVCSVCYLSFCGITLWYCGTVKERLRCTRNRSHRYKFIYRKITKFYRSIHTKRKYFALTFAGVWYGE